MAIEGKFVSQGDDPRRDETGQLAEAIVRLCFESAKTPEMMLKAVAAAKGSMIGHMASSEEGLVKLLDGLHGVTVENARVNYIAANRDTKAPLN